MIKVLLLMLLLHVIDDFGLQGVCLSNLKQKEYWKNILGEKYNNKYDNDYKMALLMHSLSWSIMTSLPIIFMTNVSDIALLLIVIINAIIHYIVDDAKANKFKINLVQDQSIHLTQILIVWLIIKCGLVF